jgi:hypothetical protein
MVPRRQLVALLQEHLFGHTVHIAARGSQYFHQHTVSGGGEDEGNEGDGDIIRRSLK